MTPARISDLGETLFETLSHEDFLAMRGLANEVPIFVQTYDPVDDDALRQMLRRLSSRLRSVGVSVECVDLFDLVLDELEEHGVLTPLLEGEAEWDRADVLETLQNLADPKAHLVPRLVTAMGGPDTQLTLVTGSGRLYPFLRTHTILESLQPAMLQRPVVLFFPGEYAQDADGGSHLRLFGGVASPVITNPYYRAMNLDHYRTGPR